MNPRQRAPSIALVLTAFLAVYVIWGSTYLAIRFAVAPNAFPPLLLAGFRFATAGVLLFAITRYRDRSPITAANWRAAALVGGLMLIGGNGLVCWAEQYVPSGTAALLIATVPLWFVLFDWLLFRGPRPARTTVLGLVIGLTGVYILINPRRGSADRVDPAGAAALLLACVSWSLGSLLSRRVKLPTSAFLATAMEMLCAGLMLSVLAMFTGEWRRFNAAGVPAGAWVALGYLVVFGSMVALTSYVWLLGVTTPARASTYAFVNPVIAVLLGGLIAHEPLTRPVLIGAAIIVASVVLITIGPRARKDRAAPARATDAPSPETLCERAT